MMKLDNRVLCREEEIRKEIFKRFPTGDILPSRGGQECHGVTSFLSDQYATVNYKGFAVPCYLTVVDPYTVKACTMTDVSFTFDIHGNAKAGDYELITYEVDGSPVLSRVVCTGAGTNKVSYAAKYWTVPLPHVPDGVSMKAVIWPKAEPAVDSMNLFKSIDRYETNVFEAVEIMNGKVHKFQYKTNKSAVKVTCNDKPEEEMYVPVASVISTDGEFMAWVDAFTAAMNGMYTKFKN